MLDDQHRSSFNELQAELSARRSNRLVFVAFDLLHLDGMDLRKLPLVVRRERLERLVQTADGGRIQFSEALPGTPQQVFDVVDRAGLEGVVCKQADSRYVSGKTKAWLKAKAFEEAEFDLVGLRRERGKPAMALLARNGRPAGSAFITLPAGIRERLWERVQQPTKPARKAMRSMTGEARDRRSRSLPEGRGAAAPCHAARLARSGVSTGKRGGSECQLSIKAHRVARHPSMADH